MYFARKTMNMNIYGGMQVLFGLFASDLVTLGEATPRVKATIADQDVRKTWILFGDPTTRLK
jgi:hypothetical protein